jgi:heme-degrading monooxygenase HmoA
MIGRIWRGRTRAENLLRYRDYVERTGLADYRQTRGNRGALILTRKNGDEGEIITFSLWDSLDAIRTFAGEDETKAHYYPEDEQYLLEFTPTVEHYDVIGELDAPSAKRVK